MKKVIFLFIITLIAHFSQAQDLAYHHGTGVSLIYVFQDGSAVNGTAGFTYAARLGVKNFSRESSLSFNLTPSISFNGQLNSRGGSSGSLGYELPISVGYNFGYLSTEKSRAGFGGFINAGYGLTSIRTVVNDGIFSADESSKVNGFYGEAGTRFEFQTKRMKRRRVGPVSMSVSLYTIQGGNGNSIAGLRLIYNLNK